MQESGSEHKARARGAGKRIRDIRRLLGNEKFQIPAEKRLELQEEMETLRRVVSRNKSSYRKKLDRYLQYKKNKQKTIRFVELVKVKRKINQLQKQLAEALKERQGGSAEPGAQEQAEDQTCRIRSELIIYKRYEDYIRLLPFFKERKYIPLFSNTELDYQTLERRQQYINDIQELKEELRMKKVRASKEKDLSIRDSFLLQEEEEEDSQTRKRGDTQGGSVKKPIEKIEYSIGGHQHKRSIRRQGDPPLPKARKNNASKTSSEKHKAEFNSDNYSKSDSKTKSKIPPPSNHHIIFSDSD